MIDLLHGDCLDEMHKIQDKSVDFICCDLPYGAIAQEWDKQIDIVMLWEHYNRILKKDGTIALFGSQPFTTQLIASNLKDFKYCWYWIKNQGTNFFHANKMPIRKVEEICIFKNGKYFPQKTKGHEPTRAAIGCSNGNAYHGDNKRNYEGGDTTRMPTNVLSFKCVDNYNRFHVSEKPVDLLRYLVKTYTNENDVVLDNCMGSGSMGVACIETGRRFVGIELEQEYFAIASDRINNAYRDNSVDFEEVDMFE
jgi:site-specific DNA-methyltransferase (adenine-specific)